MGGEGQRDLRWGWTHLREPRYLCDDTREEVGAAACITPAQWEEKASEICGGVGRTCANPERKVRRHPGGGGCRRKRQETPGGEWGRLIPWLQRAP